MGRHAIPFEDSPGGEIYSTLLEFVDIHQAIPNPHAFWSKVLCERKKYQISRGSFDYWWMKLQIAGLVSVEPETKAIKVSDVRLFVDKD